MTAHDRTLDDFFGAWKFARVIQHDAGEKVMVEGRADFGEEPKGLLYSEVGEITLSDGQKMTATRRYLWCDGLKVFFEDGRHFHDVPAQGGKAEHWCDPDSYRVAYDFSRWPVWRSAWTVSGPKKSYTMTTLYQRA